MMNENCAVLGQGLDECMNMQNLAVRKSAANMLEQDDNVKDKFGPLTAIRLRVLNVLETIES
jgi:hypothetical protein